MKYKTGEVLYVRTTEEPVCVIAERELSSSDKRFPLEYNGTGTLVVARRPVISDGGVQRYEFFDFLEEELETGFEQTARRINRVKEGNDLYRSSGLNDEAVGPALVKN